MAETKINTNQIKKAKHIFNTIAGGSNYSASIGQTVLPWYNENKPFVFQFDFRTTGLASFKTGNPSQGILISGSFHYSIGIEVVLDGTESTTNDYKARFGMGMTTANSTWDLFWVWGDYDIEPLTKYNFRITYDLTKYTVEYKKDTETTWKLLQEVESSTKLYCSSPMYLNAQGSSTQSPGWSGTAIDLNSFKATSGATTLIDGLESLKNVLGFYGTNPLINEFYELDGE